MARLNIPTCLLPGLVLALPCCVPKAVVVQETPVVPVAQQTEEKKEVLEPVAVETPVPALPDEDIRMPNFLELPADRDFRSSNSAASRTEPGSGAVVSRPPTDPPSRVKPKPTEKE